MKNIIRLIRGIFPGYKVGYEYWVNLKEIKVPLRYKRTKIGTAKWNHKMGYWLRTGEFESPIILHRDFTLADGYSSVKIAYLKGIDKVPVYFTDETRLSLAQLLE